MPEYYRIRHAQSADEVLTELRKFVDNVKSGPVITLLPSTLHEISSRDAADVGKWQEQIERVVRNMPPINATVLFWLNLLDEMFEGARHRLDELLRASHAGRRFVPVPAVGGRFYEGPRPPRLSRTRTRVRRITAIARKVTAHP